MGATGPQDSICRELYYLLFQEAQEEQIERPAAKAVSRYLSEHIAGQSPWVVGDRFKSNKPLYKGFWSVISIEAVYGINIGPFCIIKACEVLPSGILGGVTHDFWSPQDELKKLHPFWKPSAWRQVMEGDACIFNGSDGVILNVDIRAHKATVNIGGTQFEVNRLKDILIPISRIEGNAI